MCTILLQFYAFTKKSALRSDTSCPPYLQDGFLLAIRIELLKVIYIEIKDITVLFFQPTTSFVVCTTRTTDHVVKSHVH